MIRRIRPIVSQSFPFWYQHWALLIFRWRGIQNTSVSVSLKSKWLLHNLLGNFVKLFSVFPPHLGGIYIGSTFIIWLWNEKDWKVGGQAGNGARPSHFFNNAPVLPLPCGSDTLPLLGTKETSLERKSSDSHWIPKWFWLNCSQESITARLSLGRDKWQRSNTFFCLCSQQLSPSMHMEHHNEAPPVLSRGCKTACCSLQNVSFWFCSFTDSKPSLPGHPNRLHHTLE